MITDVHWLVFESYKRSNIELKPQALLAEMSTVIVLNNLSITNSISIKWTFPLCKHNVLVSDINTYDQRHRLISLNVQTNPIFTGI